MSNKEKLQDSVKAFVKAKKETTDKVNKAADEVDIARQIQTEQPAHRR